MKFFIVFFLFISTVFAQSNSIKSSMLNPDGEVVSFHVTPYITTGKVFNAELNTNLCFKVELVAPMANAFTLKLFYDYMNTTFSSKINTFYTGEEFLQLNKIGATLSFYLE